MNIDKKEGNLELITLPLYSSYVANSGYTTETFNEVAGQKDFCGWEGDLPTEKEASIIAKLLPIKKSNSVLDIACGYGRHSLLLSQEYGIRVVGIDTSSGLIKTAKRLAKAKNLDILYEVKHGSNLTWRNEFDGAFVAFNSFSLFSPEDAPVILKNILKALHQSGRLFLDIDNKTYNCRYGISDTNWHSWPGGFTLQEIFFHSDISVETSRDIIFRKDSSKAAEFTLFKRIYSEEEICNLVQESGFEIDAVFGGWDLSPIKQDSPKILLVAEKK